MTFQNYTWN